RSRRKNCTTVRTTPSTSRRWGNSPSTKAGAIQTGLSKKAQFDRMLIHIKNEPRSYAWGSINTLSAFIGKPPSGRPEAELWFGTHPSSPAQISKSSTRPRSLPELLGSDIERYGLHGGQLPFLLKILAINAPLSLQVHPTLLQAQIGFQRESLLGI